MTKNDKYIGYKVRLFPTKEQIKLFYEYFGMSRFVYNLCIDLQEEQYQKYSLDKENNYRRLTAEKLGTIITKLKHTEKYSWLSKYNAESIKGIIRDCCKGYNRFDKNISQRPSYKSKLFSKKQFYTRYDRLYIDNNYISLSSIGKIKYSNSYGDEIIGVSNKNIKNKKYIHFSNPRISFDNNYFYLSFTIPKDEKHQVNSYWNYSNNEQWREQDYSEAIGIDVGLKNDKWIVDSTGTKLKRPNSDSLNKKISRLQRKYDRQKKIYSSKSSSYQEQHPNGSKNMQKTLTKINKCNKKITNRRRNTVHEYACSLLKKKPKAVVMETISTKSMINKDSYLNKRKKLNIMIHDAALYESMMIIEQKMINNEIPIIKARKDYPSSQLCSNCGYQHNIGRAKYYRCPNCGTIIDRDINAAINLSKLAY